MLDMFVIFVALITIVNITVVLKLVNLLVCFSRWSHQCIKRFKLSRKGLVGRNVMLSRLLVKVGSVPSLVNGVIFFQ